MQASAHACARWRHRVLDRGRSPKDGVRRGLHRRHREPAAGGAGLHARAASVLAAGAGRRRSSARRLTEPVEICISVRPVEALALARRPLVRSLPTRPGRAVRSPAHPLEAVSGGVWRTRPLLLLRGGRRSLRGGGGAGCRLRLRGHRRRGGRGGSDGTGLRRRVGDRGRGCRRGLVTAADEPEHEEYRGEEPRHDGDQPRRRCAASTWRWLLLHCMGVRILAWLLWSPWIHTATLTVNANESGHVVCSDDMPRSGAPVMSVVAARLST